MNAATSECPQADDIRRPPPEGVKETWGGPAFPWDRSNALSSQALASTFGLPQERLARIEARRAFVEMKQCYMSAVSDIAGSTADLLLHKVRKADEPWELWSLRAVILASLQTDHERTVSHRMKLEREFDGLFSSSAQ